MISNPCRFLKQKGEKGWEVVTKEVAREKVCQCLRGIVKDVSKRKYGEQGKGQRGLPSEALLSGIELEEAKEFVRVVTAVATSQPSELDGEASSLAPVLRRSRSVPNSDHEADRQSFLKRPRQNASLSELYSYINTTFRTLPSHQEPLGDPRLELPHSNYSLNNCVSESCSDIKPSDEEYACVNQAISRADQLKNASQPKTKVPETIVSIGDQTDSEQGESVSDATREDEFMEIIGKLIQDLFHSDNAKVDAALDGLLLDLDHDEEAGQLQAAGGCFALVQFVKDCLKEAIRQKIFACDRVTEVARYADLIILWKSLAVITKLTIHRNESRVGISSVGGVEAMFEVMKTFPKCEALQAKACHALHSLTCCRIGKKKVLEAGGIKVLVTALFNHLDSAFVCECTCKALYNVIKDNKDNMQIFHKSGGVAAVTRVKELWPDEADVQTSVRKLMGPIVKELNSWR
jgi:hypothetical protein